MCCSRECCMPHVLESVAANSCVMKRLIPGPCPRQAHTHERQTARYTPSTTDINILTITANSNFPATWKRVSARQHKHAVNGSKAHEVTQFIHKKALFRLVRLSFEGVCSLYTAAGTACTTYIAHSNTSHSHWLNGQGCSPAVNQT